MILKHGSKGMEVAILQDKLNRVGYPAGVVEGSFDTITKAAVEAFQKKHGLKPDGVVGKHTMGMLDCQLGQAGLYIDDTTVDTFREATALEAQMPITAADKRMSEAIKLMQTCDDGQGCRYGGWPNPYQFDKEPFRTGGKFPIPKISRVVEGAPVEKPAHGGTCSPWGGLFMGWWLCANEDYNFRIGRNARWMATWPHDKVYKNKTIPGYGDYCEVEGVLRLEHQPLNMLYRSWKWLNQVNMVEMSHHVILVLKVGGEDGLHLEDPYDPGQPVPSGLYRLAADGFYPRRGGKKFYSGTKQTFRLIKEVEKTKQAWDVYRVADLDQDACCPTTGPWANRTPWELGLE